MRETLGRNFDVVVVVWSVALAMAWMLFVLSRADLSAVDWSAPGAMVLGLF